jgi:glycosyltransferase involved in cell wall biosynthesis
VKVLMAVVSDLRTDARVRREATALAEAGHEVCIIGFDYTVPRATVRHEGGVTHRLFPFPSRNRSRSRRVAGAAAFCLRAAAAILSSKADVIHSHNLHLALPCLLAARLRHAEFVYDAHEVVSTMHSGLVRRAVIVYERFVWKRASAVITTNDPRADFLERLHGGARPLVLGNYPLEPEELHPVDLRTQLGIPADHRILIYQGGFYVRTRAFAQVAEALAQVADWEWVLVGFGSENSVDVLRKAFAAAGVTDRTHILPPVPAPDLLHITAGADAGVVPLLPVAGQELGDTNKLYEYLIVGLPAMANDFPELRATILDNPIGPVGTLFDAEDPASIVSALRELDTRFDEFRGRASEVGHAYYSWAREGPKLAELYARLEHGRRPGNA